MNRHAFSAAFVLGFFALACTLIALNPAGARAQEKLTCPWAARAYAQGEIGNVRALEYLNSCIDYRIKEAGGDAASGKAPTATEPKSCHEKSGLLAINPDVLTLDDLVYLRACVDADLKTFRKAE